MPAFGEVNTPGDQLIWRQLCQKEKDLQHKAPRSAFAIRSAINKEEVPSKFKPCQLDPSGVDAPSLRGFDPEVYGWDPKGELALEFGKCRKRALAPPAQRFLYPETSAQDQGWILKVKMAKNKLKKSSTEPQLRNNSSTDADKQVNAKSVKSEVDEKVRGDTRATGELKRGLGNWASDSHLSSKCPSQVSRASRRRGRSSVQKDDADEQSGIGVNESESHLSAALPSELCPSVTRASNVGLSELSGATSSVAFPHLEREVVRRQRAVDANIESALAEVKRYMCYGQRGNRHFHPLGQTDATDYANKFMKATSGVPPHKWDPRALPGQEHKGSKDE